VPGRYAKAEASSGLVVSIEAYVYRPPVAAMATSPEEPPPVTAPDVPAAPSPMGEGSDADPR